MYDRICLFEGDNEEIKNVVQEVSGSGQATRI